MVLIKIEIFDQGKNMLRNMIQGWGKYENLSNSAHRRYPAAPSILPKSGGVYAITVMEWTRRDI